MMLLHSSTFDLVSVAYRRSSIPSLCEDLLDLLHGRLIDAERLLQDHVVDARLGSEQSRWDQLDAGVLRVQNRQSHGGALRQNEVHQPDWEHEEIVLLQRHGEQPPGGIHESHVHLTVHHGDDLGSPGVSVGQHEAALGVRDLRQRYAERVEPRVVDACEAGDEPDAARVVGWRRDAEARKGESCSRHRRRVQAL